MLATLVALCKRYGATIDLVSAAQSAPFPRPGMHHCGPVPTGERVHDFLFYILAAFYQKKQKNLQRIFPHSSRR